MQLNRMAGPTRLGWKGERNLQGCSKNNDDDHGNDDEGKDAEKDPQLEVQRRNEKD